MKSIIKRILKSFPFIYYTYNILGSFAINLLKLFIKSEKNLILFVSFGGKKYDDSPKVIYEFLKNCNEYRDYKFVWAFENPDNFALSNNEKVKIDTLKYYIVALRARVWVTNSSIQRGLNFKRKETLYLNTWHGTPIKKMGLDIAKNKKSPPLLSNMSTIDIMLSQSNFETDIFSRVFKIPRERFLACGLPRNDELVKVSTKDTKLIRDKLGIKTDKKIILYAPTFREYEQDNTLKFTLAPPIDFEKWNQELGEDYMILLRAHYEVGKVLNVPKYNEFIINVSDYSNLNDLMIISDVLISDYSSIFFDFSLLQKPMICYAYDLDAYTQFRGMYFDINKELPGGAIKTEDELLNKILNLDYTYECKLTKAFQEKYVKYSGDATQVAVESIINHIN
ncbi:CDP-glycerol glycerophosphotransferase family protein [Peribacillus simplex]